MAWGIPGNVGEIYRKQQSDELKDQLLQQTLAQRIREFDQEQQQKREEAAALAEDRKAQREYQAAQLARQTKLDTEASDIRGGQQRAISNVQGLVPFMQSPEGKAEVVGQALRISPDRAVSELLKEPPEPKPNRVYRVPAPGGGYMNKSFTPEEEAAGIKGYQEPQQGREVNYEWVIRDGQPVKVPKDAPSRPGDQPYDPVAARTREGGGPSQTAIEHSQDVITQVDQLVPRIGILTAGPVGALLSNVSGTEAANVSAELGSLGAKIAFDQLQRMREASKTGGALGNVSDTETKLLTNVIASIQQNQSPANLRKNLAEVKASAQRFLDASMKYGPPPGEGQRVPVKPGGMGAGDLPMRKDIPGIPGAVAESTDGGKTWKRVK